MPEQTREKGGLFVLYAGFFLLDFDLVVINPLLLPAAYDFRVSLGTVTLALTAYLLLFGIMQPVHGSLSDMVGRVRVMRVALAGMGAGNLVAAIAPHPWVLIAGRAVAGAFAAALAPLTLAYLADRVPIERRQRTMAALLSVGALGSAAATVVAGVLASLVSWRLAIVSVGLAAPVLAVWYGRLPETVMSPQKRPSTLHRISQVLRGSWFRFLIAFTFIEGAVMLGFFNFFNAALQTHGNSILIAGVVTSTYGFAALAGGIVVRLIDSRTSAAAMFGGGSSLLFAGYAIAAYAQTVAGILIASVLAGLALSVAQSTIQTWAVEVATPGTLGVVASLVACSVFTGAAVGTATVGGLATAGDFQLLFAVAAAITLPVTVVGTAARARFARATQSV